MTVTVNRIMTVPAPHQVSRIMAVPAPHQASRIMQSQPLTK